MTLHQTPPTSSLLSLGAREVERLRRAIARGAPSYQLTPEAALALSTYIGQLESSRAPQPAPYRVPELSPMEQLVAEGIMDGLTAKEIAHRLGRSRETINTHIRGIRLKTGKRKAELAAAPIRAPFRGDR